LQRKAQMLSKLAFLSPGRARSVDRREEAINSRYQGFRRSFRGAAASPFRFRNSIVARMSEAKSGVSPPGRNDSGIVRPSALAVVRLTTSSNLSVARPGLKSTLCQRMRRICSGASFHLPHRSRRMDRALRSLFVFDGPVHGLDVAANSGGLTGGPLDQERVSRLGSRPAPR
jgi:hypothetical protein